MKILETKEKRTSYPENLSNHTHLLAHQDMLLSRKTQALIESLKRSDTQKADIIQKAFKDWIISSKKFESAKQIRGKAFPLALFLTLLMGVLIIPALLIAPLLPSEIIMLLATPVCLLLALPQICVLIEVSIEKFIHAKQQSMKKFSKKLNLYCEEIEKNLAQPSMDQKSEYCIIEGLKMTQYGTLFSIAPVKSQQNSPTVLTFSIK